MRESDPSYVFRNVSRETMERLEILENLVLKWNPRINLISKASTSQIFQRHIQDSLQISLLSPEFNTWVDLGSGGGFPALVVATHRLEFNEQSNFVLIESDQRKSVFLRTAIRELGLRATVVSQRIEEAQPQGADVLSARALAPLDVLLSYAERHLLPEGVCFFPKGESFRDEISKALESWTFQREIHPSVTNPNAAIVKVWNLKRV